MGWLEDLKSAGLQAALIEHGPRVATGVLAALLAIQAGILVTSQNRAALPGPGGARAPWPTRQVPSLELSNIVGAHLFGTAASAAADPDAPQTAVQLVLAGVLAVPDPKRGLAIIGPNAGAARLYAVGSAVPGGVSLHAVYRDRVLLDRGGIIESLLLPKKLAAVGPPPVIGNALQSPAQRLAALAQGNGALLGGLVRAQPVFAAGKLTGYRIFPGGRASISTYTQLGLRPGDLVTAVNGTLLDDPNRGNEILQTLSSAASATLTVLRNGQSQDLNLNLETVVNEAENAAAQAAAAARRGGAFSGGLGGSNHSPGLGGGLGAPGLADGGGSAPPPPPEVPGPAPNEE